MAIPHLKRSAAFFLKTGETRNIAFALRDIGRLFSMLHKPDSAIKYYRQALLYADSFSRFSVLNNLGDILAEEKDYPSAFYYIRQSLKQVFDSSDYYPVYLTLGKLFYNTGVADSARYYLNISKKSSRSETRAGSYFYLYHLARSDHQWQEYAAMQERYEMLRDSILSRTYTSQMVKMQHLYDYQQAERKASGAELASTRAAMNNFILLALILLMTGSLAAYTLYSRAVKRREQQLQDEVFSQFANKHNVADHDQIRKNIDRNMQLGNLLNSKSIRNKAALRLEKKLLELENARLSGQREGKEKGKKPFYSSDIYNLIINGPVQMVSEKEKEAFMAFTDEIYPGLRSGLVGLYPSISRDDLFVCYLTRAGIRGKRIAELFFISKQAVSARRKRLAEILKGDEKVTRSLEDILASL